LQVLIILSDDQKQSEYIRRLKKYLHDYADIIATVKHKPNTDGLKLIEFGDALMFALTDSPTNSPSRYTLKYPAIFEESSPSDCNPGPIYTYRGMSAPE